MQTAAAYSPLGFVAPAAALTVGAAGGPPGMAVSLAVSAVSMAISALLARRGPRQKEAASSYADQAESLLKANLEAWRANPSSVDEARANFLRVWQGLVMDCGQPELGEPGRRCLSERDRGGRFDWWAAYYDPLADVSMFSPGGDDFPWLVLALAAAGVAFVGGAL